MRRPELSSLSVNDLPQQDDELASGVEGMTLGHSDGGPQSMQGETPRTGDDIHGGRERWRDGGDGFGGSEWSGYGDEGDRDQVHGTVRSDLC